LYGGQSKVKLSGKLSGKGQGKLKLSGNGNEVSPCLDVCGVPRNCNAWVPTQEMVDVEGRHPHLSCPRSRGGAGAGRGVYTERTAAADAIAVVDTSRPLSNALPPTLAPRRCAAVRCVGVEDCCLAQKTSHGDDDVDISGHADSATLRLKPPGRRRWGAGAPSASDERVAAAVAVTAAEAVPKHNAGAERCHLLSDWSETGTP